MQMTYISKSAIETNRFARKFLRTIVSRKRAKGAVAIGLVGNLGAGKTTFTQAVARVLGVKENVLSPTFVLMKVYKISGQYSSSLSRRFKHLVHIDCYRLDSSSDLVHLGFRDIIKDTDAIVLIEWADRIKKILPKETVWVTMKHGKKQNERIITLQ